MGVGGCKGVGVWMWVLMWVGEYVLWVYWCGC